MKQGEGKYVGENRCGVQACVCVCVDQVEGREKWMGQCVEMGRQVCDQVGG